MGCNLQEVYTPLAAERCKCSTVQLRFLEIWSLPSLPSANQPESGEAQSPELGFGSI